MLEKIKKVKIGGVVYTVKVVETVEGDDGKAGLKRGYWGLAHYPTGEIRITNELYEPKAVQTLLHEIIHILDDEYWFDRRDKERMIEQIGNGLYQVLVDNPALLKIFMQLSQQNKDNMQTETIDWFDSATHFDKPKRTDSKSAKEQDKEQAD